MAVTRRALVALAASVAAVVLVAGAPASAHGGAAIFEVLGKEEGAPGQVDLRVAITYESDGDPAEGAIVDVVATGPDGSATAPVRLERTPDVGVYAAPVALPAAGSWTLTLTSSFPPGTLDVPVTVAGAAAGAGGTTTTAGAAATSSTTTSTTSPTTSSTTTATAGPGVTLDEPEVGGVEGGSDTTNLVVAAVAGVIGGGLGLWASQRRSARKRAEAAGG